MLAEKKLNLYFPHGVVDIYIKKPVDDYFGKVVAAWKAAAREQRQRSLKT